MNGSMFAVHLSNPITSRRRQREADDAVMERHRMEREVRESTRKDAYLANQEMEETFRNLPINKQIGSLGRSSTAESNRFKFEADSEDEEDEEELDAGLVKAARLVGTLHDVANGMNSRVSDQTTLLDRLGEKVSSFGLESITFDD